MVLRWISSSALMAPWMVGWYVVVEKSTGSILIKKIMLKLTYEIVSGQAEGVGSVRDYSCQIRYQC